MTSLVYSVFSYLYRYIFLVKPTFDSMNSTFDKSWYILHRPSCELTTNDVFDLEVKRHGYVVLIFMYRILSCSYT
jgi:hypothetical protein